MPLTTKSQPYRLDWQSVKDIDGANTKLSKLWIASDSMFEILFKELKRVAANARTDSVTFANLPTAVDGLLVTVTDSTTQVWGAVITGGGTFQVLAYFNGTNWTVAAI